MLIKALILDCHKRIGQIFRNLFHVHPLAVFLARQLLQHLLLSVVVLIIDDTVELHGQAADVQIRLRQDHNIEIQHKCADAHGCCCQANEKQRQYDKSNSFGFAFFLSVVRQICSLPRRRLTARLFQM